MAKSNNEINKERMYEKIMPTGRRQAPAPAPAPETDTPLENNTFSAARIYNAVNRTSSANRKIHESQDMLLVNAMEDMVLDRLDTTLARFNCCKCNKCKKDIAAVALNRLTPKYIVLKEGDTEKRKWIEDEYGSQVTGALVQAILLVKKNPRH